LTQQGVVDDDGAARIPGSTYSGHGLRHSLLSRPRQTTFDTAGPCGDDDVDSYGI
jgi:hypothetical protein